MDEIRTYNTCRYSATSYRAHTTALRAAVRGVEHLRLNVSPHPEVNRTEDAAIYKLFLESVSYQDRFNPAGVRGLMNNLRPSSNPLLSPTNNPSRNDVSGLAALMSRTLDS